MFETTFNYSSATPLPPNLSIAKAVDLLHDFELVMKLNPDCHSTKPIPPPKANKPTPNTSGPNAGQMSYFEVEDDLPFMPKKLWSGGVRYTADFLPTPEGCDITVHAPGGFTSTNHWRLLREVAPTGAAIRDKIDLDADHLPTLSEDQLHVAFERLGTKDLVHAETESSGAGWYVEIVSDARCPRTFVSIIKGFLKNSHAQLEHAFIDRLKVEAEEEKKREEEAKAAETAAAAAAAAPADAAARPPMKQRPSMGPKRPTLSRRRSSVL